MNAINTKSFKILESWQYNLNEGNLSEVLKLYNISFVLIPTFSSEIITDHEQLKKYFLNLLDIQKATVEFKSNSISEQKVCENTYLLSGQYFFHENGGQVIPARFSFLVNILSENPIMHHHSSRSISN